MNRTSLLANMDFAIVNISELMIVDTTGASVLRNKEFSHPTIIKNGAIAVGQGTILWSGKSSDFLEMLPLKGRFRLYDGKNKLVTPGLIDPHTHLIFGGTRENEFVARIEGKTYQEIAKTGGGIKRTVKQTREASEETLFQRGKKFLADLLSLGITTIEVKSGYGLELNTELKMLRVAKELDKIQPVDIVTTFLGAHEFPPEMNRDEYISYLISEMIPAIARENLADFCDIFLEKGVFTQQDALKIMTVAQDYGLQPKIHADQLSDSDGAKLATSLNAASADHLNHISDEGILALAKSNVVAVLLPGSDFFLGLKLYPPARKLIESGAIVSIATDFNPGSCMTYNLPLIMTISNTQMRLTPAETFSAVTLNAAAALNLSPNIGSLQIGKDADILVFSVPNHEMVTYHFGTNHIQTVFKNGKIVHGICSEITQNEFMQRMSA